MDQGSCCVQKGEDFAVGILQLVGGGGETPAAIHIVSPESWSCRSVSPSTRSDERSPDL